jgi:N-carbamoyl-L-amino-acid hydrolase
MTLTINSERLQKRLATMSRYGATDNGGVDRQALSEAELAARRQLVDWAAARGFRCTHDAIGNLFILRPGTSPDALPVALGSHLDSQPTGGNYDGVFGVLAAFECLESLEDNAIQTTHPVIAVSWMNEEGCRFSPTTMGSSVYAGTLSLEAASAVCDYAGVDVASALKNLFDRFPDVPVMPAPAFAAYLEAHIEQGPVLEAESAIIGVVTGVQGLRQYRIDVRGETAHAGTTLRKFRKDAFVAARRIAQELDEWAAQQGDFPLTIGSFVVSPGAINTVPSHVAFTIDVRAPNREILSSFDAVVADLANAAADPCSASCEVLHVADPVIFDPVLISQLEDVLRDRNVPWLRLLSGATHDAARVARRCPAAMLFVPSRNGISHNEAEFTEPDHLAEGARMIATWAVQLDSLALAETL